MKTLDEFYRDLGLSESSGRYDVVNRYGYAGKYQMGEQAMAAAGYYKKNKYDPYYNDWSGKFLGTDGINSLQDFLSSPQVQEKAQINFKRAQWNELINHGATKYLGQKIKNVEITASALLGGAHLKGASTVALFIKSGGKIDPADGNGVKVSDYMKKFQDYDVAPITNSYYEPKKIEQNFSQKKYDFGGLHKVPSIYDTEKEKILKILQNNLNPLGIPTGFAASVENIVQQPQSDLAGYTNPLTGTKQIFTREDVGAMTPDEFSKHEKEIDAQLKAFNGTMPSNSDLQRESISGGGVVYVNSYTRSDGTEVRGYYRSR